jgi:flap endonuclease-1
MGVKFTQIVSGTEIALQDLAGKRVAIDSFNFLYQFLAIIRGADGRPLMDSKGRVTSHLSGLFYRTVNLLEAGVKPVYVFDGPPPKLKSLETAKRREVRAEAKIAYEEALEKGELEEARKQAQRAVTLTDEMIADAKKLLAAMGLPAIQAPSEGEALCSQMAKAGDVWCVATQDYDSLLFGAPRLVRNLSISGRRKFGKGEYVLVNPEMIVLKDALKELGISHDQLIVLAILVGTDYNPGGIRGIGPKKALKLVKEKKGMAEALEGLEWQHEADPREIFEFFKKPPEAEYTIEFGELDPEKVRKIMVEEHEFSAERIDNGLERLKPGKQKGLGAFARKK